MHFLIDQDVYSVTVNWLRELGHDVLTAKEIGMERAADQKLLRKAREYSRVFVTRDKDFGALVFLRKELSAGVILLRMDPRTIDSVHEQLKRLLKHCKEEELNHLFCVVEPDRYRERRIDAK